MRKMLIAILTTAALAATTSPTPAADAEKAVVGQPAPDFTLPGSDGASHSLSDYEDTFVVLEWLNYDCPFVKKHYSDGNMQKLQKTYGAKGVTWFSICSSAPGKQGYHDADAMKEQVVKREASPKAVLIDSEGTVGRLYGAKTTPHIFIINPGGILVYQGAIDDIPSTNPDDVARAKNYVSTTLDACMAGDEAPRASTKPYGCGIKYASK